MSAVWTAVFYVFVLCLFFLLAGLIVVSDGGGREERRDRGMEDLEKEQEGDVTMKCDDFGSILNQREKERLASGLTLLSCCGLGFCCSR